jgi:hypothetical protein
MSSNSNTDETLGDKAVVAFPERWIKKRYGVLLLLSLALWPFIGLVPPLESLVVNGLLLDSYWQLAYLTITNVVAFFFAISILRLLGNRNPGGKISQRLFGDSEAPWGRNRVSSVVLMSVFAPLFLALLFGSEFPESDLGHLLRSLLTVGLSTGLGVAGLWGIGFGKCWIFGSDVESANYFPFESRLADGFGFIREISLKIKGVLSRFGLGGIDVQFFVYLSVLAMVHHQLARRLENNEYWLTSAPSMLVLFLWLIFMILSGLANWLDRWRIPTFLVFVLLLTLLMSLGGSTRSLNTFPDLSNNKFVSRIAQIRDRENDLLDRGGDAEQRQHLIAEETSSLNDDAWRAITNRMTQLDKHENKKGKTLVVVTCPGGGIHASAWASCVLDRLSEEYVEFEDSLTVISGVSGGSVGTLMFVGSRYENELQSKIEVGAARPTREEVIRDLIEISPALELSSRSSLEAIAFGATVDDLYNLIGIDGVGRGQRLEDSFNSRLPVSVQAMTIGQWGDCALDGAVPIVIFNSTDAVTGRRILFDTIPSPRRESNVGLGARPMNYRELLDSTKQGCDLLPATAARTSATFPYISPFTKPSNANDIGEHVAICDGGYVDNEGIVTAVNWIEFFLKRWELEKKNQKTFDRILLLRIEPSSVEDKNQPADSGGISGAFRWLIGPGETMVKVRSASQLERGNLEAELAAFFLKPPLSTDTSPNKDTPVLMGNKWSLDQTQQQGLVEVPQFDKRKFTKSEIRENWEQMLDEYQASSSKLKAPSPAPLPKATSHDVAYPQEVNSRVVIRTITFVHANQSIPLNWKLSNRQKLGYQFAWELCAGEGTALRETLNRYFNRKK